MRALSLTMGGMQLNAMEDLIAGKQAGDHIVFSCEFQFLDVPARARR